MHTSMILLVVYLAPEGVLDRPYLMGRSATGYDIRGHCKRYNLSYLLKSVLQIALELLNLTRVRDLILISLSSFHCRAQYCFQYDVPFLTSLTDSISLVSVSLELGYPSCGRAEDLNVGFRPGKLLAAAEQLRPWRVSPQRWQKSLLQK